MTSFLRSFNMFPESRFMRIRGESEVRHVCGGIATLIMVGIVVAVLAVELKTVFERNRVTVSYIPRQTASEVSAPLTTFTNTTNNQRFMIGYGTFGSAIKLRSSELIQNETRKNLTFEDCTFLHFFPNKLNNETFSPYRCLTMNESFSLKGVDQRNQGTQLDLIFECQYGYQLPQCFMVVVYFLKHTVNPNNFTHPWIENLQIYQGKMMRNTYQTTTFKFEKTTLKTKPGLFPFQSEQQTAFGMSVNDPTSSFISLDGQVLGATHQIVIGTSNKQQFIQRKYYTVLDVLAYAGGILSLLFTAFFFMCSYGSKFYQLFFAKIYFRNKEGSSYNIGSWLKEALYNKLRSIGFKPNWEDTETKVRIRKTIKKLLSFDYMQRRIEFLENAVSILLEKHHWKGVHFLSRMNEHDIDKNYHEHRFRDRIMVQARKDRKKKGLDQKWMMLSQNTKQNDQENIIGREENKMGNMQSFKRQYESNIEFEQRPQEKSNRPLNESVQNCKDNTEEEMMEFEDGGDQVDLEKEEDEDEVQLAREFEYFLNQDFGELIREKENGDDKRSTIILERMDPILKKYFELYNKKQI